MNTCLRIHCCPRKTHINISPVALRRRVYLSPVRQHQVRANATGSDKLNRKRAVWRGSTSEFISADRGFESRPCPCIRSPPHRSQAPLSPRPAHFACISTTVFYTCKSKALKWGTLRNLFCNGRVIYDLCEGSCTYVYTSTTCLSTLMVTYSLLLLAVTSSKMRSLPTK